MSWPSGQQRNLGGLAPYHDRLGATRMMAQAVQDGLVSNRVDIDTTIVQDGRPVSERFLRSDQDLADYASSLQVTAPNTSNIIFSFQPHSHAPLDFSAAGLDGLLLRIDAFPAVSKLFQAFVPEETDCFIGRALVHLQSAPKTTSELVLLLKYVAKNTRDSTKLRVNDWSIRNLGVYQKHDPLTNSETVLLINVSEAVGVRTKQCLQGPPGSYRPYEHWTRTPLLILGTLSANWSSFATDLHKDVTRLANDSSFTNPDRPQTGEVSVQSLEQCASLLDKLQQAMHALQTNLTTLEALKLHAQQRYDFSAVAHEQAYGSFLVGLDDTARELGFTQAQLELIKHRLDRTTAVIRDLISLRSTHTVEKLTKRSMVEARTVRLIAIVSLLFIPPTFTTVSRILLGIVQEAGSAGVTAWELQREPMLMRIGVLQSFIQADMVHPFEDGFSRFNIDNDLWFWFAITFPLMLITLGGWLYWDWRTTKKMSREWDSKV